MDNSPPLKHFGWKLVLPLCAFRLPDLAIAQLVVVFNVLIVRRQVRFFQTQLQSDAQTTPLSHGVCTNAAPQNRKIDGELRTEQEHCKWYISVDAQRPQHLKS